jgi:hypothetical protein
VIDNNIEHEVHAAVMKGLRESLEIVVSTKVLVDGGNVGWPVAFVGEGV